MTTDTQEQFADRLRAMLGEESVRAFAARIGMSHNTIQKLLEGAEPRLSTLRELCVRAHADPEWLLFGDEGLEGGKAGLARDLKTLLKWVQDHPEQEEIFRHYLRTVVPPSILPR